MELPRHGECRTRASLSKRGSRLTLFLGAKCTLVPRHMRFSYRLSLLNPFQDPGDVQGSLWPCEVAPWGSLGLLGAPSHLRGFS